MFLLFRPEVEISKHTQIEAEIWYFSHDFSMINLLPFNFLDASEEIYV